MALSAAFATLLLPTVAGAHEVGVMLDAGIPDGANASLVYRPWDFIRLAAGGGTNLVAPGFRAGVSLILPGGLSATAEAGHYFSGDANGLARNVSGDMTIDNAMLRDFGYDYQNLRLGIEFGPSWATFFVQAGMSHVSGNVRNVNESNAALIGDSDTTVTVSSDPSFSIWSVSARAGLIVAIGL